MIAFLNLGLSFDIVYIVYTAFMEKSSIYNTEGGNNIIFLI
jgi:hypothetical protein